MFHFVDTPWNYLLNIYGDLRFQIMRIKELFTEQHDDSGIKILRYKCSQFLDESEGYPLLKNLPKNYNNFQKVKVRVKKRKQKMDETFNKAFDNVSNLRQRAVFTNGADTFAPKSDFDPFYVFPINGFKYIYNTQIVSETDYKQMFNDLMETAGSSFEEMITELLKYTYTGNNLVEGIKSGSEIILYNIPHYYVVRQSAISDYDDLLTSLM